MRIIPAIDIIDGKCVRLTQGDYAQKKIYNEKPLEVAKGFQDAGFRYLHLVDLDGAKVGKVANWKVVEEICSKTNLTVDFGGGIKKNEEIKRLLDLGVQQVNLGSVAVKDPESVYEWISDYGADKIILSADVKNELIAISGWQEGSSISIIDFITQYTAKKISHVTCTDISTDGTLKGPNVTLYKKLLSHFPNIRLVASGGVGSLDDIYALQKISVDGVIVGKAIYEGKIMLHELVNV